MRSPHHQGVSQAYKRILSHIKRTRLVEDTRLNSTLNSKIYFKCENEQLTGSFKVRGAHNAILQLKDSERKVITHSSGNHGAAIAFVAQKLGKEAYIVIPEDTTESKRENMLRYDAKLIECEPCVKARDYQVQTILESSDMKFIHPYDNAEVIHGQGTATYEFLDQLDVKNAAKLDQVWVPVGGGGLASGAVLAANGEVEVVCAEPENVNDTYMSLQLETRQPPTNMNTIADGLRAGLGKLNFEILRDANVQVALVTETEIKNAANWIFESLNLIVEPSAAVVVAAMLKNTHLVKENVGVILTGGNVAQRV